MDMMQNPVAMQPQASAFGAIDQGTEVAELAQYSLTTHVRSCYRDAQMAKTAITQRLLKCERQRRGQYDPEVLTKIQESGGSEIFMMLTDIKCRAAESWIKDVSMASGDEAFSLSPTIEPSLPPELKEEIAATVMQEAIMVASGGMPVPPEVLDIRLEEMARQMQEELLNEANERCSLMQKRISDLLQESDPKWDEVYGDMIDDFVTFPTAVLKGPVLRKVKKLKWGPNYTPMVTEDRCYTFRRVSPYNIFPGPGARGVNDTYICERHPMTAAELQSFIGVPGYNDKEIQSALELYDRGGMKEWLFGDDIKDRLDGKESTWYSKGNIEAVEFWGSVTGRMLKEWGMTKDIEDNKSYEANVWIVGPFCIRAVLNPDPLGARPYSIASFVRIPGAFWGQALPELMSDVQQMCNSAARALQNNMAMASGPMAEITIDRLAEGESVEQLYPWRQFQTTSDKTGGGQPAIRFFQPEMNVEKLLLIYNTFSKQADEVTGVPNYIYGSTQVGGAGRTASGLSMLMENAAKGIKHAILYLDQAKNKVIERVFQHLMIYDPDPSIKGDMQVVPAGVVATLIKDSVQEKRQMFLDKTANPIDLQIMGLDGRAAVLRETAKDLDMDVDHVVPDPKVIKQQQQMQQMLAAQQQPGPPQGQGGPPQQQPNGAPQGVPAG